MNKSQINIACMAFLRSFSFTSVGQVLDEEDKALIRFCDSSTIDEPKQLTEK